MATTNTKNCKKDPKMAENGLKLPKSGQKMAQNGLKCLGKWSK